MWLLCYFVQSLFTRRLRSLGARISSRGPCLSVGQVHPLIFLIRSTVSQPFRPSNQHLWFFCPSHLVTHHFEQSSSEVKLQAVSHPELPYRPTLTFLYSSLPFKHFPLSSVTVPPGFGCPTLKIAQKFDPEAFASHFNLLKVTHVALPFPSRCPTKTAWIVLSTVQFCSEAQWLCQFQLG